jgi:hypothetical protein
LIYLAQGDVRTALQRVAEERPPEWRGFEGFIAALEIRQSVELSFLARSGLAHLVVDVTGGEWRAGQERVAAFLREA